MDSGRFDAWTRRRFGLGVSGLAAGLLGMAAGNAAADNDLDAQAECDAHCAGEIGGAIPVVGSTPGSSALCSILGNCELIQCPLP